MAETLFEFAKNSSPWTAMVLALVIIIQLLGGKRILKRIRGTQAEKYPELAEMFLTMKALEGQNKTLLENHFKHEIPDLVRTVDRIEEKVDTIKDDHGNRLTRLETLIKLD